MTRPNWGLFAMGWMVVLAGSAVASIVQTWGGVELRDVRFETENGTELSALLYVPPSATSQSPAPAVLAVHGYINSRETQSGFAIELARRGFVALALDQPGHGFSDGRAMSEGFGGPAGLEYLRSLPFVDAQNIGLEGHSMGGWAVLAAARAHPDAYQSMVLVGSATGPGFADVGTPTWPRNLGVVFSRFDEFSQLMWGVRSAADVVSSEKLQRVFDAPLPIHPGQVYGSAAEGTARWLAMPNTTHPGEHLSREAIGYTVNWLSSTLEGEQDIPPGRQIWFWKELGTLIALLGALLVLLGAFELLLSLPRFAPLAEGGVGVAERMSGRWWLSLAVASLVPAVTYFPLTGWGSALSANALLPQSITNQILVWALGNGALALPALWMVRRRSADAAASGGLLERGAAAKILLAVLSVAAVYAAALVAHWVFKADFRFWVVALKPMATHHVPAFLAYVLPFTAFFYVTQRVLHATLSLRWAGPERQYATGLLATAGGLALLVAVLYAWLFAAGHLPGALGVDVLFTVIAIQFVPVLAVTGVVAVFTWRRTNGALAGAVICGLLVTWYIVAGQATHA
jgi:pimeloyl-ACP methyl ester carboxylesterase